MENEPISIPSKKKYKVTTPREKHLYRTRTGPHCCNGGCGSTKKKSKHKKL